jgi:CBS domain containing-hemolysin-like protein
MSDYIRTLQTFFQKKIPPLELSSKTIADLMTSDSLSFRQKGFQSIDAEDSVQQLYMQIQRQGVDYVPVVDPDTGSLVSVLGYLDLGHLLDEAAKQHPRLFGQTVEMICNDRNKREEPQITAPRSANLAMVLEAMEERNMTAIPVLDESNCVVGLYYRTDVAFITRAANADAIMSNLEGLTVGEALQQQQQQQQQQSVGEAIARVHPTVRCGPTHLVSSVLNSMMMARTTIVVCVGEGNLCLGTISIADILRYFFDDLLR